MSIIFSDDFGTGTEPNTTNWTETAGDIDLVSGKARGISRTNAPLGAIIGTTTTAHAAIADVRVNVDQGTTGSDSGPCARITNLDSTPTMYVGNAFGSTFEVLRYNNSNTATSIGSVGITMVGGAQAGIKVTGTGATVTIECYYNGVLVTTLTDTNAARITAAGQTGVVEYTVGNDSAAEFDDFEVDDLVASETVTLDKWYPGIQRVTTRKREVVSY